MSDLNATSRPSASGARVTGDDLQHLIAWYWCLKTIADPGHIDSIEIEAAGVGNLDDVKVNYTDRTARCIQVKATVDATNAANVGWLTSRPKPSSSTGKQSLSLLQKSYGAWIELGKPSAGIEIITGKPLDGTDDLFKALDRNNTLGPTLRRSATRAHSAALAALSEHLECEPSDVCDFFDVLELRVGQTEADWRVRVADIAMAAGVQSNPTAVAIALDWIRTWVKTTRDPRSAAAIQTAVRDLGLQVEQARTAVTVHGLAYVPAPDSQHEINWIDLFSGDSPENRRGLVDPDGWNSTLLSELASLRSKLQQEGSNRILLRGTLRLPCWFAVGAALSGVAGFDLAMDYRGEVWRGALANAPERAVQVVRNVQVGAGRTVLIVAISTDPTDDVEKVFVSPHHGRIITIAIDPGPSQTALRDGPDANAAAHAIRDWVRAELSGHTVDLVLATPAPFAAFLGSCWDRMPETTVHEDLIHGYEPAFTFSNISTPGNVGKSHRVG